MSKKDEKKIDVLLAEYQQCHRNRNHYDSIRWTIGSIFIATSLGLFGISFIKEVRDNPIEVVLTALFSLLLIVLWHAYNQHVNPYVMASIKRFHEIELELCKMKLDVRLHYSIAKEKQTIRGAWITYFFLLVVLDAWIFRLTLLCQASLCKIIMMILALAISPAMVYIIHMRILNKKKWGKEIREIVEKREKIKKRCKPKE